MNEVSQVSNPFGTVTTKETAGARTSISREVAEVQARHLLAKQFPRDVVKSMDRIINAFARPSLAEKAQYEYAKGGNEISGPSIKAMEAIATHWGNVKWGFKEISRGIGHDGKTYSEVHAFAIDMETLADRDTDFIVPHWRDTRNGGYKLTDERDIYELMANQAQRRVRSCLQAVIPSDVVDTAMSQANTTLKATADTSQQYIETMLETFQQFGVQKQQIEARIQKRIESITPAQVMALKRIFVSLRDGMSEPSDWFDMPKTQSQDPQSTELPADFNFELKSYIEEACGKGTSAYRTFWTSMARSEQVQMSRFNKHFQELAAKADKENADQSQQATEQPTEQVAATIQEPQQYQSTQEEKHVAARNKLRAARDSVKIEPSEPAQQELPSAAGEYVPE